jgi:hypothetical protein
MKKRSEKRLLELEGANPGEGIVLHFEDGSTRFFKIHKKSVLPLWCAGAALNYWAIYQEHYTPEARAIQAARTDVPPHDPRKQVDEATGRPITKFDFLLELLGRAVKITGPGAHHLVAMAWAEQRDRVETLRRGRKFYYTYASTDPFFANNCEVGPGADYRLTLQLPLKAESDAAPDVLPAQPAETQ